MNIAFICHSYHKKTRSHQFILDLLWSESQVDIFYDDSWSNVSSDWAYNFNKEKYDIIVIHQMHQAFAHLKGGHPNIVFIPMYDAMVSDGRLYWRSEFNQAKILCFSWQLRQQVTMHNPATALFQFFPNPSNYQTVTDYERLRGFFWYRVKEIDPTMIFNLCREHTFEKFIIHNAPDPGKGNRSVSEWSSHSESIEMSTWVRSRDDYIATLRQCNVFFAPRPREGIGMSFLEAMASGMCVVAPYEATMNEYISNGTNGLLYQFDRESPLNFSRARDMGLRARESVERGFQRWRSSIPKMLEFIATPTAAARSCKAFSLPRMMSNAPLARFDQLGRASRLTVITVCLNAADTLEETIGSVIAQDAQDIEYIIVDGGSTDGTVDLIKRYAEHLACWRSAPDAGVCHAMNIALEHACGDWVLFLNSDNTFVSRDAVSRMFAKVPEDTDVVYGHHIYRRTDGIEEFRRAADFDVTWDRLRRGDLSYDWLAGIPAHQATAIRRSVITNLRFDTRYKIAANHDLLFRARRDGKRFFNCDELVVMYVGDGLSAREYDRCKQEWAAIARTYGDPVGADRFFAHMDSKNAPDERAYQRLRDFTRRMVLALHKRSPALGGLASAILRRQATLWLVRGIISVISKTGLPG
jgi:glycosyltransferase involved in cell wall biosynthesis